MRIVTRADFDGIVCAALLYEAEPIRRPTLWVEPSDMQHGRIPIDPDDIIANLPYVAGCALWFDHHITNQPNHPFKGLYKIAPSAARLVHDYYKKKLTYDYTELIRHADEIDAANLTLDQVRRPEEDPYLLLSMTISGRIKTDESYWNRLVQLLRSTPIDRIMADREVTARSNETIAQNARYKELLNKHTCVRDKVAITDFRSFEKSPDGNRFLVYSLFPEAMVAVKIRYAIEDRQKVIVSVGRSIFNPDCRVNIGKMLSGFEGGGHAGAGAASFHIGKSDKYIPEIINTLVKNEEATS